MIELGTAAGWVCDMAHVLEIEIQVANPNHEAWRWKSSKRKTDRDDALKLAQMSQWGQLPMVHVPKSRIRQWRSFIAYRNRLVARRTAIKNSIRAILERQGLSWPSGRSGWTKKTLADLSQYMAPIEQVKIDEL